MQRIEQKGKRNRGYQLQGLLNVSILMAVRGVRGRHQYPEPVAMVEFSLVEKD